MPRWLVGVVVVLAAYFPAAWLVSRSYVDAMPKGKTVVLLSRPFDHFGDAAVARLWVPNAWLGPSDTEDGEASTVLIYEDDYPLGPAHATFAEVALEGRGRYLHVPGAVVFSASDNSDPNSNGHRYWAVVP